MGFSLPHFLFFVVVAGGAAWLARNSRWPIRIVVDASGRLTQKGVAVNRLPALAQFFQDDIQIESRLTILARRRWDGSLELKFKGRLAPDIRQQVRNYLITVL